MASDRSEILMFHRVMPDDPAAFGLPSSYRIRGTALTPAELEAILDRNSVVASLEEVERALSKGNPPPPGVVLTFDDGYREHLELVLPVLKARSIVGTFYVSTGVHAESSKVAVVDAWYWLLDHARAGRACVHAPGHGRLEARLDSVGAKRWWVAGPPKQALLEGSASEQERLLAELAESARCDLPADLSRRLYLSRADWAELVSAGMRVGAHGVTHARLAQLDDGEMEEEVRESIRRVPGDASGVSFAYPDGSYSPEVVQAVRHAGAMSAVTCVVGDVLSTSELLRLPRRLARAPGA